MVAKQGARWRIGSGANIPLLGTSWLKDGRFLTIDSPTYAALAHAKVKDIIEPMTKVWNISLISNFFLLSHCPNYSKYYSPTIDG